MIAIRQRVGVCVWAAVTVLVGAASTASAQQAAAVRVAAVPALVNCGEKACFRMLVNAYDAKGEPVPVGADAVFEVSEVGAAPVAAAPLPTDPASPPAAPTAWWQYRLVDPVASKAPTAAPQPQAAAAPRYLLLVVDTSGSMLEPVAGGSGNKFQAAVDAIRTHLLDGFQAGADHMAIVGFDSRRVRARIEAGTFEDTKAAVQAQLDGLAPKNGNTALYSAVDAALDKLKALGESGRASGAQVQLLVFTDGKNDVNPAKGDDSGLLEGADGLAVVEKKVRAVTNALKGLEVVTIGLGDPGRTYDPEALRRLAFPDAKNAMDASSLSQLQRVFEVARSQQLNRVFLTFGPVRESKDHLTAPIAFTVKMMTPGGVLEAQSPRFEPPPIGLAPWDGRLTGTENLDFRKWRDTRKTTGKLDEGGLPSWAMRLIVLATFGATLAVLWFGLPRLVWPERYVPRPSFQVAAAPAARGAARPPAGRPATQKGVTITGRAVSHQRGGSAAAPPTVNQPRIRDAGGREGGRDPGREGGRDREPPAPPAPPARPRVSSPNAPPRPAREPFVRGAGDATVFVPPTQNRGGNSDE